MSPRAGIAAVFALNGAAFGALATRIPAIQDRLELSDGRLGLALAAVAGGALISMPLAGAYAARAGSLRATRVGIVWFLAALPLLGLAPSLGALLLAAAVFGAGNGFVEVSMNAHAVALERARGRPLLSGFHAAFSFGGFVGAAAGAAAAGAGLDVRAHLALVAAGGVLVAAAAWRALAGAGRGEGTGGTHFARPTGALWLLGGVAFLCLMAEGAAADWSAVYVDDDLGAGAAVAGLAYAAFSATMTLGRVFGDRVVSALGPARVVRGGSLVAGCGLAAALLLAEPGAAIAGFALLGLGLSSIVPVVFRAAGELPGHSASAGLAAVSTVGYTGFVSGPPLIGAIAEAASLPVALGALAVLVATIATIAGVTAPRAAAAGAQ